MYCWTIATLPRQKFAGDETWYVIQFSSEVFFLRNLRPLRRLCLWLHGSWVIQLRSYHLDLILHENVSNGNTSILCFCLGRVLCWKQCSWHVGVPIQSGTSSWFVLSELGARLLHRMKRHASCKAGSKADLIIISSWSLNSVSLWKGQSDISITQNSITLRKKK